MISDNPQKNPLISPPLKRDGSTKGRLFGVVPPYVRKYIGISLIVEIYFSEKQSEVLRFPAPRLEGFTYDAFPHQHQSIHF